MPRMFWKGLLYVLLCGCLLVSCHVDPNFHAVDGKVWRSSQLQKQQFTEVEKLGIKEVLNLRRYHSDDHLVGNHLICHHVRMRAGSLNDEDMFQALKILVDAEQPIVVHCLHGADRTGAVIAMYRIVVQGWTRQRAIEEMMEPQYGHHAELFPNVRIYLENVDIVKMRKRLELRSVPSGID